MNTAKTINTIKDPEAAWGGWNQTSRNGARVVWAIALLGPVPFVIAPILVGLSRIVSLPVYLFALFAWSSVLFFYAFVVCSRWNKICLFPKARTSQVLVMLGIACQVCALILTSTHMAVLGWILLAGAWLATHAGEQFNGRWRLLSLWPASCMLVQLPHFAATQFDNAYLRLLSIAVSFCLDSFGVPFRRDHSHFEFARSFLSVEECLTNSPFIVWMLFVSCVVFSCLRRPIVLLPAYVVTAAFWAFGMHLVQLGAIGWMRHAYMIDFGTGWLSVLLNVTTLFMAFVLILSTDRCLRILFTRVPLDDSSTGYLNPINRLWNRMLPPTTCRSQNNAGVSFPVRHLLNPWCWCKWFFSFTADWILSRPYSAITPAFPAIALGTALVAVVAVSINHQSLFRESRYLALFDESVKQKDFELAAVAMKALLDLSPDNLDLQYQQALLDELRGNRPAAIKRMEDLATSKDHGLAAMWIVARECNLQELKKWSVNDHARFRHLIETGLSNLTGENLMSAKVLMFSYLAEIGAFSDAERYLAEVVPVRPELALAAASLCRSQQDTAGVAKYATIAQRHFESKLSRKPTDILARIDLARVLMIQTKFEDAARLLNDGYRLTQDSRLAGVTGEAMVIWSNHLATGDMSSKNLVKRLQILHAAVGIAPSDPFVGSSIAQLLIDCRDNRMPEVVQVKEAILDGVDPVSSHFVRGTLALLDGHATQAKTHLELALQREPNAPAILNNLAVALAEKKDGNLEQALSLVNTALEKVPSHTYFLETRGQIHLKLDRWQESISDLEDALETPELRPAIYPSLAVAYEKMGAKDMTVLYRKLAGETQSH